MIAVRSRRRRGKQRLPRGRGSLRAVTERLRLGSRRGCGGRSTTAAWGPVRQQWSTSRSSSSSSIRCGRRRVRGLRLEPLDHGGRCPSSSTTIGKHVRARDRRRLLRMGHHWQLATAAVAVCQRAVPQVRGRQKSQSMPLVDGRLVLLLTGNVIFICIPSLVMVQKPSSREGSRSRNGCVMRRVDRRHGIISVGAGVAAGMSGLRLLLSWWRIRRHHALCRGWRRRRRRLTGRCCGRIGRLWLLIAAVRSQ